MAKRKQPRTPRKDPLVVAEVDDGTIAGADETATKAWKAWKDSRAHLRKWRQEAAENYDIIAGKQWTEMEEQTLREQLRPVVTFNRTTPVLDAISGYQINGRQDVTFVPRENEDSGGAQVVTSASQYFREACDAEDNESDAFYDLLVAGLGVIEHRMDYEDDPEGMLKVERIDPLEMGYDPAATKANLLDRRWDIRGKWWDKKVAEATWPGHDFSDVNNIAGDTEDSDQKEPIDRVAASFYADTGIGEEYERKKGKVFILEHTWFENEPFTSAVNPLTGKMEEIEPAKLKQLGEMMAERGMKPPRAVKRQRKKFMRAFVHGKETLEEGEAPCPEGFHYQFMTGKRDRNTNIWYGVVRQMKDPQRWANKWLSQTLHILNSGVKGTTEYEKGAFENVAEVENKIAKPGAFIGIEPGFFEKVRVREAMGLPPTTMNLTEFAISSIRDATGVNVELLGMTSHNQPGVVENARKQSAMAILAPLFNALRNYRKQAGRLTLYFIKTYMSDGRKIRVVGQGAAKYVPLTDAQGFDKYDVVVDESPSSPNQKEAVFGALAQVLPQLMKQGVPVPPDLLDYIPGLPQQLIEKWKQFIDQKASQPPPPDQKAQVAQQKIQQDAQAQQQDQQMDFARLSFDKQLAAAETQGDIQDRHIKVMELGLRREEIASRERIELAKLGHNIVRDHHGREHDKEEAKLDREAATVQAAQDRESKQAEG